MGDHELLAIATTDGARRTLPCDGVMIEIGLKPVADFISFVAKDKGGLRP